MRGDLSDPLWKKGARLADFVLADGSNPAVTTEAYALWDTSHLYVAFVCRAPQISVMKVSQADRNDPLFHEDSVELYLVEVEIWVENTEL